MSERYKAERGTNQPDVWYIRDYNVPPGCGPVIIASTTSEHYANVIAQALNLTK